MATKLKLYRDKKGLTQAALAFAAGLSERSYNVHERGKGGRCHDQKQAAIASVLGVKPSILFDAQGRARS